MITINSSINGQSTHEAKEAEREGGRGHLEEDTRGEISWFVPTSDNAIFTYNETNLYKLWSLESHTARYISLDKSSLEALTVYTQTHKLMHTRVHTKDIHTYIEYVHW